MKERKIVVKRLDDTVNMQLLNDWQPLGGVSTLVKPNSEIYFIQALVKYEEELPQNDDL